MYYIAGPFFNDEQKAVIKGIENLLDVMEIKYFSPREYGVITDESMTYERMERIYEMNIHMVDTCKVMIAVLDDRDSGTIFEIGYAAANHNRIITYSTQGHGINVMLKHAVKYHCNGPDELEAAINGHGENELEISE